MKQKRLVSIIGMLVVLFSTLFMIIGCGNKPFNYVKENISLKFKNETGKTCYVEISGFSSSPNGDEIAFPAVLKTEIPADGTEKTITVKDVTVIAKNSDHTHNCKVKFSMETTSIDANVRTSYKSFYADTKDQYSNGIFHIKKEVQGGNQQLIVEFTN
ncbi:MULTISPECIES: hypothetical protein [unclassified Treponema]|uniref:hypothetical protein n=1 Tax=unclassified Treponema TaxID=2638727 RepID=UPI0020A5FE08|nr:MULTISPECIES: hypothetical protein [unclassified Treponema]UTC67882.1 hypothetical protein E4O06_04305 [Treponema sp. OMZ 789]UTC70603.1 hypothetical protein E4O01_04295 [Treponema sp. OMZ 790]UTC73317.1 hypothetical protein E4O02_04460 [Treponema sp. OMZ 791]